MLDLDLLQTQSLGPLSKELGVFIIFVEGWCGKLETPVWCVCLLASLVEISRILVEYSTLVIAGHSEGPDLVFLKAMIDSRQVRVRRVRIKRISLQIIKFEYLIIIVH